MAYVVNWEPAVEDVRSLESTVRKRIVKKVGAIANNPFRFVERLEGYSLFKLRVGDYRAILDIKSKEELIIVVLVGHRSKVYQELARHMG